MPRATVDLEATETFDLKTLPEGYVTLRKMSYGQKLERMALVTNMTIKPDQQRGRKGFEGHMQMAQTKVTAYEMRTCIVDHNLEDERGNKLDFSKERDISRLDPRVGEEIGSLIDKMNQFDADLDEGEQGNS